MDSAVGSQLRNHNQQELQGDMEIDMKVNTYREELPTLMKAQRPQTTDKPVKGYPYSRDIVVPQGPAGGIGAMIPRFAETAKYGTTRQKIQKQAENQIFGSTAAPSRRFGTGYQHQRNQTIDHGFTKTQSLFNRQSGQHDLDKTVASSGAYRLGKNQNVGSSYDYEIQRNFQDTPKTIDHLQKNFYAIKDNKNSNFTASKKMIQEQFNLLDVQKITGGELSRLKNLTGLMNPQIKQKYLGQGPHRSLTQSVQALNIATIEFCNQVSGYKIELCHCLQNLLQCFNVIFLKQYETFYKSESEKDKNYYAQILQIQEQKKSQDKREVEIEQKRSLVKSLLSGKDDEIENLRNSEAQLNQQIEHLNQMLEEQWKDKERMKIVTPDELKQAQMDIETKLNKTITNDKYEELLKETSQNKTEELNEALDIFYQNQMNTRQQALQEIQKTVGVMMQTSKADSSAQTDDSLMDQYLKIKEQDLLREKETEESMMEQNGSKNGQKPIRRVRQFNKEPTPGMKKLQIIQSQMAVNEHDFTSIRSSGISQKDQSEKGSAVAVKGEKFMVPPENTNITYGWTKRQLFMADKELTLDLQKKLDEMFDLQISKEVKRIKDRDKEDSHGIFGPSTWSLPSHIITFLENSIRSIDGVKFKLIPWPDFKKVIWDIIDHRIENSPEINGVINTSYMSLDEHLVIYSIHYVYNGPITKSTREANGTRMEIEAKLIEILFNLKYYSTRWLRAKLYSEMLGFLHVQSSYSYVKEHMNRVTAKASCNTFTPNQSLLDAVSGLNDQQFEDVEIPPTDIYTQEFFFYAYTLIMNDRKSFQESSEGFSYIRLQTENKQTAKILKYMHGDVSIEKELENWKRKVRVENNVRQYRVNPLDEKETDFVDVDMVMRHYLEDYRNLRQKIQKNIYKVFTDVEKRLKKNNEVFSMKDIKHMMSLIVPEKHQSPSVHYPREVTFIRAFIYSLVCGENSGNITKAQFLAACNRYGIDNPCPIITKRISFYGNQEDLVKDFQKQCERFKELNVDPDLCLNGELKGASDPAERNKTYHNFKETKALSPVKKLAGITNFMMIQDQDPNKEPKDAKTIEQDRQIKLSKDFIVGGVKMKITDIQNIALLQETENPKQPLSKRDKKSSLSPSKLGKNDSLPGPSSPKLVAGMTAEAHLIHNKQQHSLTFMECGVSDKRIVIPTFQTTSKLFIQHFQILREMKHRIDLLRQAYEDQRSMERSWEQITQILEILDTGCYFLDFPGDDQIQNAIVPEEQP